MIMAVFSMDLSVLTTPKTLIGVEEHSRVGFNRCKDLAEMLLQPDLVPSPDSQNMTCRCLAVLSAIHHRHKLSQDMINKAIKRKV